MLKFSLIFVIALTTAHAQPPATEPPSITLQAAIARARANEPAFAAAVAAQRITALDHSIARAAILPNVNYHNQALYTQPNGATNGGGPVGSQSAPRFIANNAVREYASQGTITETLGAAQFTAVARAAAANAVAIADLEIARRGLVAAVTSLFYESLTTGSRLAVARRAANEASAFTQLTQQRETAREAAHADVVKAELQQQQRQRDLADAGLAQQRAQLDLAVLLFPDPRIPYTLIPEPAAVLPAKADVDAAAMRRNPELQQALASLRVSTLDVTAARAAYLPSLGLNFTYGIDAVQFAVNGRDGVRNLGYSTSATLDIPVWDWLSTQHKVRQSEILRDTARVTLTATQRRLVAELDESYAEASVAHDALQSLQQSVDTANESLRLTRLRYTAGEATVLEVVDAQNSLTQSENAYQDGMIRFQIAFTRLQLLTGAM